MGVFIWKWFNSLMLCRVSSAAINSTSFKVFNTLKVISSRFPIGVAHKYNFPAILPSAPIFPFLNFRI